jgi:hypothetical protein
MGLVIAEPRAAIAERPGARSGLRFGALAFLEQNGTLVMLFSAAVYLVVAHLQNGVQADSWMVLLAGRDIVAHGLPSHDAFTVWAHGRPWIDQQWLAQVTFYGVERLGGYRLVMLFHAALVLGAFGAACGIARRRGAAALSVTWIGVLGLLTYYPCAAIMRSQSFAYGLFVGVFALLTQDSRQRSRRVFFVFPLLVVWANLHGSVVVGAALVSIYGFLALVGARRAPHDGWARGLLLVVVPWACVLASPYADSLPTYYRTLFFDTHFSRYITEWSPTAWGPATAPVYVLVVAGVWLLGRARGGATRFEVVAFFFTSLLAFQALRNMAWVGLTAVIVLPALLDRVRTAPAEPRRINRVLASAAIVGALLVIVSTARKSDSWFVVRYPTAAADAAAASAGKNGRIFANEAYADWLIWNHPDLAGRIAFDARFELLNTHQLGLVQNFRARVGNWRSGAAGYDVLVLSGADETKEIAALTGSHDVRKVAEKKGVVVLHRIAGRR